MIITLKKNTPQPEIDRLIQNFEKQGVQVNMISGANYNVFGLVGDTAKPVSYTHLDVYKRQIRNRSINAPVSLRRIRGLNR